MQRRTFIKNLLIGSAGLLLHGVAYAKTRACGQCNGSGNCSVCWGSGKVDGKRCFICSGSGKCGYCHGTGQVNA